MWVCGCQQDCSFLYVSIFYTGLPHTFTYSAINSIVDTTTMDEASYFKSTCSFIALSIKITSRTNVMHMNTYDVQIERIYFETKSFKLLVQFKIKNILMLLGRNYLTAVFVFMSNRRLICGHHQH